MMDSNQNVTRYGVVVFSKDEVASYGKVADGGYGEYSVSGDTNSTLTAKG